MPTVKLPDGRRVKFPDSMTKEQITQTIETELMPKETPSKFAGREGYSYLPTGEAISPEQRRAKGERIAREQIKPILGGGGAVLGAALLPGAGGVPGAGLGYAAGERLSEALAGRPVGTISEEAKRFAKETGKGATIELVGKGVGKAATKSLDFLKNKLYESAVKFSTKLSIPERMTYVKAGLEKAVFPTEKGLTKLGKEIDSINSQIDKTIKFAQTKGKVNTQSVVNRIDNLKNRYKHSIDYDEVVEGLDGLRDKLLAHGPTLSAEKAQGMKVLLYRDLKNRYGEMKDFAIEGKKTLARGLMEELETLVPEIKNLNKTHAAYRGLEKEVTRAAGRISNRELISLLASTSAAAGGAAYQGPEGLTYGLAVQLLVSPRSKTGMAIALNKALKAGGAATIGRQALTGLLAPQERLKEPIGTQVPAFQNYRR